MNEYRVGYYRGYPKIIQVRNGVVTIENIRALYRQATTDDRYKSLFIEFPETTEIMSEEEFLKSMSEALILQPGDSIVITFTAK